MATAIYLLPILLSLLGFYCSFSSTFLTLLVLVLSTSFSFILSKIKRPKMLPEDEVREENKASQDEGNKFQTEGLVLSSGDASLCHEGLEWPESDLSPPKNECRLLDSSIANVGLIPSESLDGSVSDHGSSPARSEGLISDDDSLIELTLPDGHYQDFRRGFLPDFSPESVFLQSGLMDLLSDVNEEDDLMEIDIAMGSIKCSRFEIKA